METPEQTAPKTKVRKLTVCSKRFPRMPAALGYHNVYIDFPAILLTGKWLRDSGFRSGHVVDVACWEGRLVITLSEEQRFEGF